MRQAARDFSWELSPFGPRYNAPYERRLKYTSRYSPVKRNSPAPAIRIASRCPGDAPSPHFLVMSSRDHCFAREAFQKHEHELAFGCSEDRTFMLIVTECPISRSIAAPAN